MVRKRYSDEERFLIRAASELCLVPFSHILCLGVPTSTGCRYFPAINTFIANSVLTLTYWSLQAEAAFSKRNSLKQWMQCMLWPRCYQDGRANKPQLSPWCPAAGPYTDGDTACRREGSLQARFMAAKSTHLSSSRKNQQVSLGACNTHVLWLTQPMQVCGQVSTGSCSLQSWLSNPYRLTRISLMLLQTPSPTLFV